MFCGPHCRFVAPTIPSTVYLVPDFPAVVTSDDDLFAASPVSVRRRRQLEPRVRVRAFGSRRAEPGEVVQAQHSADVTMTAAWTVTAEAAVVPGAVADLGFGVDVQKWALLVMAGICRKEKESKFL